MVMVAFEFDPLDVEDEEFDPRARSNKYRDEQLPVEDARRYLVQRLADYAWELEDGHRPLWWY
jgi:hypothetical protein